MKKLVRISLLTTLLILGQPLMAFAETVESKTISFEDVERIIAEQSLEVRINENKRLKTHVGYSGLKSDIKELEDELDDIDRQRDELSSDPAKSSQVIALGAEKRMLLDTLEQLERNKVDQPILEAITDLQVSISDNAQIRSAEGLFINYNQLKLAALDLALSIDVLQNQLVTIEIQESLGMVSHNDVNDLKTKLVDMQTKLESTKFQQDSLERQLRNLLNEEKTLVIEGIPPADKEVISDDQNADLEKVLGNSYTIKLQELQIVSLQNTLQRAKKDYGRSSKQYKMADYDLLNANLKLTQMKESLKSDYYEMVDDLTKMQSNLSLAEQSLEDKKAALSDAQLEKGLGMISQLELEEAITAYQATENLVENKQIELFHNIRGYEWLLEGISSTT